MAASNYHLDFQRKNSQGYMANLRTSLADFWAYLDGQRTRLGIAFFIIIINSAAGVITPFILARAVDTYISQKDYAGLNQTVLFLAGLYILTVITGYLQTRIMGIVSQNTLFTLRTVLFTKLQELPIAFFNQNKAGDLISRLNNDTDKLNQFLSQSIIQFVGNFFLVIGIGVFILFWNFQLALIALSVSVVLLVLTQFTGTWVERLNRKSLNATGALSGQIDESLSNFKAIVAFNRRDYFQDKLHQDNEINFQATVRSEFVNSMFRPLYDFAGNIAQIAVLGFGLYLISQGNITIGLLIGFLSYTERFYSPLRILGSLWGSIQSSLAAWARIQQILVLESDLTVIKNK